MSISSDGSACPSTSAPKTQVAPLRPSTPPLTPTPLDAA